MKYTNIPADTSLALIAHLEYFGYTGEVHDSEFIGFKHETAYNLLASGVDGGVLFEVIFGPNRKLAEGEIANYFSDINAVNRMLVVSRAYQDDDGDFVIKGWYPLPYDKRSFSTFIASFLKDLDERFNSGPSLWRYWEAEEISTPAPDEA